MLNQALEFIQVDGTFHAEDNAQLVRDIYQYVLQMINGTELEETYALATEGSIPLEPVKEDLKVLLKTENETLLDWVLGGFVVTYQ